MIIRLILPDRALLLTPAVEQNGLTVTHTESSSMHTLTLTAHRPGITPVALEVELPLPEALLTPREELYLYNNSAHTNDVTGISLYTEAKEKSPEIPELGVFKNLADGQTLLVGLVTLQRFWSAIHLRGDGVVFRFELEERELIPDTPYVMERFLFAQGTPHGENALLEAYADAVARENAAIPTGDLPVGWCSWSCFYGDVSEAKIRAAADMQDLYGYEGGANLIQIDDGWQRAGSFCGEWVTDEEKFPEGMAATSAYVREMGMTFGLWLAPLLLDDRSEYYEGLKHLAMPAVTLGEHYHPFNLGHPEYHEHLRKTFRRMVDEFGARYFKLDFLAAAVRFFNGRGHFVKFEGGYCIELQRKALQVIRETVGDDVFLLSCGAQTLVGAGIFNGARMSCDIIWGKSKHNPTYWQIMQNCLHTVGWRYFYHRKVYVNDPDGLVLRDWDRGDGFNSTWSEAELWTVAIAMSGGSVLSNDELEKLSDARRKLYTDCLPPLDIPCRPVDYFELPAPTAYVLEVDESTKLLALYHFGDDMTDLSFDLSKVGMQGALVADCLTHRFLGFKNTISVENANPHSAAMFLLRKPSKEPAFVGSDANIYMGINLFGSEYKDGNLIITRPEDTHTSAAVYALWPEGFEPKGEKIFAEEGYVLTRDP